MTAISVDVDCLIDSTVLIEKLHRRNRKDLTFRKNSQQLAVGRLKSRAYNQTNETSITDVGRGDGMMGQLFCTLMMGLTLLGNRLNQAELTTKVVWETIEPEEVAELRRGARVEITTSSLDKSATFLIEGTVLRATIANLELVNCDRVRIVEPESELLSRVPLLSSLLSGPEGVRDLVPLLCIPSYEIASTRVIRSAPAPY